MDVRYINSWRAALHHLMNRHLTGIDGIVSGPATLQVTSKQQMYADEDTFNGLEKKTECHFNLY